VRKTEPAHFKVGALEGMIPVAARFCRDLQKQTEIQVVQLDVEDLARLDERFLSSDFDVIFTHRLPSAGAKKFRYLRPIGYQTVDQTGPRDGVEVLSAWEFGRELADHRDGSLPHALVSNSLGVRKVWLDECKGKGSFPSAIRERRPRGGEGETVYVVGADRLSPALWSKIERVEMRL
jgi:hypothetical protein